MRREVWQVEVLALVKADVDAVTGNRAVNQNTLPMLTVLATPIVPPMASAKRREIANPKPLPPYLRLSDRSIWEKFSNSRW